MAGFLAMMVSSRLMMCGGRGPGGASPAGRGADKSIGRCPAWAAGILVNAIRVSPGQAAFRTALARVPSILFSWAL